MRSTLIALAVACAVACHAVPIDATWVREKLASPELVLDHPEQGAWVPEGGQFTPGPDGIVVFTRGAPFHARFSATLQADLSVTPWLQFEALGTNAQWRLTAQAGDGPELVVFDRQVAGMARRDLSALLGVRGPTALTLRLHFWGWADGESHYLRARPSLVTAGPDADAHGLLGEMATEDARYARYAESITPAVEDHPRLRFNQANRDQWRRLAAEHPECAQPLTDIIERIDAIKTREPYVFPAQRFGWNRPPYEEHLLSMLPPEPPPLRPGEGRDPLGVAVERGWRQLYWHDFSYWLIGAALSDDPAFVEQAKRWALALVRWRFWLWPDYIYFDMHTSYPLQCLCSAYDVAWPAMSDAERAEVREAIATLADGLYANTLSGRGSIYNDLRGNHTAVTMCGLGMAGLTLLGEDERAAKWVALAERFMLDCFELHTSGGWAESPAYGAYGVSEWVRLAEMLRNVTGRNHLGHPFLRRFADYQLHVADWEGRNLGYNDGGAGEYWNQWVFHAIAREFRDPRFQWLGHPDPEMPMPGGYGDAFWWIDPDLPAQRPTETDTGRYFADIGVSVWRSGWDEQATILLHHCGLKGQHKEENMNHVTLYALGRRVLPDGLGPRTTDHNVPVIDDLIQNKWMPGATLAYHCDRRSGYALGDAQSAYFGARRHVLFLRPDVVVLIDELSLGEQADRSVRFLLHPSGECAVQGNVLTVRSGEMALQALTALPDGTVLPMEVAAREPPGRATHDAQATFVGRGSLRAVTFLLISPTPEPPAPTVSGDGARLRVAWGDREVVLGLAPGEIAPGFATDAELWLARMRGGAPEAILVPGRHDMGATRTELATPAGIVTGSPAVSWARTH
ncbi:MAG: DUF4962 domain-containing protein [Armatimonadota bacterium]